MLGWWTILHLLTRRETESITFSVPDRNTLWSRVEDGLLVETVTKYITNDVVGRDWREVASETSGHLSHQCQERYRFTETVEKLTFVFLCVTFRGSPFCSIPVHLSLPLSLTSQSFLDFVFYIIGDSSYRPRTRIL